MPFDLLPTDENGFCQEKQVYERGAVCHAGSKSQGVARDHGAFALRAYSDIAFSP